MIAMQGRAGRFPGADTGYKAALRTEGGGGQFLQDSEKQTERRGLSLQYQMLAGFVIGLALGLFVHLTARDADWVEAITTYVTGPIGQLFLRLLFMLVIPLLWLASWR